MHIKKIKEKSESLSKITTIVESKKNITLINILKLSKQIAFYFERANQSKKFIETLEAKYAISNPLIQPELDINFSILNKLFKSKTTQKLLSKTIWVYVTETEQYETNSYSKHEKNILKNADKDDYFIAIGESANKFCQENNFNVVYSSMQNEIISTAQEIVNFIENFINFNGYHNVKFVINSSKIKQEYLDVIPLQKMNFNLNIKKSKYEEFVDIDKLKIYPDVDTFIDSEIRSYLTYITLTLLSESGLIYQKYKLVAENKKINDLEKKGRKLRLEILRAKREREVEEISILSKKKILLHTKKD
ncbi:hypothetical protein H9M94_01780 [Mycoplasma sp. Pen4]|uniref:MSC_0622 family F1-like ATPase gamma subunit n=1 Tax=Mycoplasma sp. Pen4 TaxID=640330 RepID=UPI001654B01B|nr:hypothetical protein [Mycoplasma sp. Pen4]QNM93342.1 hypothetical protein H9M94_01780 [Mycoplasma sp. Pen4]